MISEYHMERKINYFIFIFYFYNWLPTPPGGVSQFGRLERKQGCQVAASLLGRLFQNPRPVWDPLRAGTVFNQSINQNK